MKIFAPVKDFNGIRNNVRFVNGVGETNNQHIADWFRTHGYKVAIQANDDFVDLNKIVDDSEFVDINKLADEPDFESMTPHELRDWAKSKGYGGVIKNIRNKGKLIEILRG